VDLGQAMSVHGMILGIDMCEVLGRGELEGVVEGVVDYIVFLHQLLLQFVVEVLKCSARIGECCMPTITRWRQLVCKQERIASSVGIEARVDVEKVIALESFCESKLRLCSSEDIISRRIPEPCLLVLLVRSGQLMTHHPPRCSHRTVHHIAVCSSSPLRDMV